MLRPARGESSARPLVILIVVALILTAWQHKARSGAGSGESRRSFPERLAVAVVWPAQKVLTTVGGGLHQTTAGLRRSRELAARCTRLQRENDELRAQQLKLIDALIENQRLKRTLGFAVGSPPDGVPCRVVAINYSLGRKRLTIAAPRGRVLEVNNIVRTEAGLVGRVVEAEAQGSRGEVFLLVDAEHAVSARVVRSRDQGMVHVLTQGESEPDALAMEKIIGRSDVRDGDWLETSGLGGVYPPGIPIGLVTRVERSAVGTVDLRAIVRPFVDFDRLEWVLVERHGR